MITVEKMTASEYANWGASLAVSYSFSKSPFGQVIIASTSRGIVHVAFADDKVKALKDLKRKFPKALFRKRAEPTHKIALDFLLGKTRKNQNITLHLTGTDFQFKVWQKLLTIPRGETTTYEAIAKEIKKPKANRAVGTAVGANPIAYIVPCHRVLPKTGDVGNYRWGSTRKKAMLEIEGAVKPKKK
jgi:AraC family transcriptional regulator of adaptative response/methylated-DNA-[protein]-cysteine methyltransferase